MNPVGTYPLASDGGVSIPTGGGGSYAFAPGMHALTATYVGDNSFSPSTSSALNFSVTQGTPFVVVGVNTNTATVGQTIGVHAVVSGFGSVPATGAVQFTDNGTPVGSTLPLQTGGFFGTQAQAATLLTNLQSGQHVIGANYLANGDVNYTSVVSGDPKNELTQTVAVTASSGPKSTDDDTDGNNASGESGRYSFVCGGGEADHGDGNGDTVGCSGTAQRGSGDFAGGTQRFRCHGRRVERPRCTRFIRVIQRTRVRRARRCRSR